MNPRMDNPTSHGSIACPACGGKLVLKKSRYGKFYGCENYPKCTQTHGAHPDGKPLGIPADKETRDLRIVAHDMLSRIYDYRVKEQRNKMYQWLAQHTSKGHISMLMKDELLELIEKLKGRGVVDEAGEDTLSDNRDGANA